MARSIVVESMVGDCLEVEELEGLTIGDLQNKVAAAWFWPPWRTSLFVDSTQLCVSDLVADIEASVLVAIKRQPVQAVAGYADGLLRHWDLETGEELRVIQAHNEAVNCVAVNVSAARALTGGMNGSLKFWDLDSGSCLRHMSGYHAHIGAVLCMAAELGSSVGRISLSGSNDGALKLCDPEGGIVLHTFLGHVKAINSVVADFAAQRALSGGDDCTLQLWDLLSRKCLISFGHFDRPVTCVAGNFHAMRAISGSLDLTIWCWDLTSGSCIRTVRTHPGVTLSLATNFEASLALIGCDDGALRCWDTRTGECTQTLEGHQGWARCLAADLVALRAVTGGDDGFLRYWDLKGDGECILTLQSSIGVLDSDAITLAAGPPSSACRSVLDSPIKCLAVDFLGVGIKLPNWEYVPLCGGLPTNPSYSLSARS